MLLKKKLIIAIALYLAAILILISIVLFASSQGLYLNYFSQDPLSIALYPFYYGILSSIGIVFWCLTCGICLLSYRIFAKTSFKNMRNFFFFGFLISFILMADDFFLIHEQVMPMLFGIYENVLYVSYGLVISYFLLINRKYIFTTSYFFIGAAFALFVGSTILDAMPNDIFYGSIFYEDSLKFLGIISWFLYFSFTAVQAFKENFIPITANSEHTSTKTAY